MSVKTFNKWYKCFFKKQVRALKRRAGKPLYKKWYAGRSILDENESSQFIYDNIRSGKPFLVCRFGSSELNVVYRTLQKKITGNPYKLKESIDVVYKQSGFFPKEYQYTTKFTDVMLRAITEADLVGIWCFPGEEFVLEEYVKDAKITPLENLEPWNIEAPWSAALYGKKVLVVHPFDQTIKTQYKKREELFLGTDILPSFELITYKSVQTIAGNIDDRFGTWFEALEFMAEEIREIDFDVAILGCGAYGLPLASEIKKMGKQAIHLGGATQLMFGIKGKRWDVIPSISKYYNDDWTRPSAEEKCGGYSTIEGGCYW